MCGAALSRLLQQLRQGRESARSQDQVHIGGTLEDGLPFQLCYAAGHADEKMGIPTLEPAQPTEACVHLVAGFFANSAGVEQDQIGLTQVLGGAIAKATQSAGHLLRVVHVHLAAPGLNGKQPHRRALPKGRCACS